MHELLASLAVAELVLQPLVLRRSVKLQRGLFHLCLRAGRVALLLLHRVRLAQFIQLVVLLTATSATAAARAAAAVDAATLAAATLSATTASGSDVAMGGGSVKPWHGDVQWHRDGRCWGCICAPDL